MVLHGIFSVMINRAAVSLRGIPPAMKRLFGQAARARQLG